MLLGNKNYLRNNSSKRKKSDPCLELALVYTCTFSLMIYLFIILPVSLLAEDELVRSHLQTLDVPVQVTRDVNPIQVLPARTLSSMYQQLGKSTMLPLFLHCHTLWFAKKIAHIFLNQSGLKSKQILTDSRSFNRAFWRLQVIFRKQWLVHLNFCACCDWLLLISRAFWWLQLSVSRADWFIWISALVIGHRNYLGFFWGISEPTELLWKMLPHHTLKCGWRANVWLASEPGRVLRIKGGVFPRSVCSHL